MRNARRLSLCKEISQRILFIAVVHGAITFGALINVVADTILEQVLISPCDGGDEHGRNHRAIVVKAVGRTDRVARRRPTRTL